MLAKNLKLFIENHAFSQSQAIDIYSYDEIEGELGFCWPEVI